MESVPYNEKSDDGHFIRTFDVNTPSEELKWHFDDENRIIIPIKGKGWKIQIDESLPEELIIGKEYFIPVDVYHRLIKGQDDLEIKLFKLDSVKSEQPKHVRKYSDNPNFSDYLIFHIQNEIPVNENLFRYGSDAWCDLLQEARQLHLKGMIELNEDEVDFLEDDPGKIVYQNEEKIILNTPFRNTEKNGYEFYVDVMNESEKIERVYFNG